MVIRVRISVKCQLFLIVLQVTYGVLPACGLLYIGCFVDTGADRDLPNQVYAGSLNEPVKCISECSSHDYTYAGLQYTRECYCGNSYGKHGQADTNSECNMVCPANSNYKCGGGGRNSVYRVDPQFDKFKGCYKDEVPHDLWAHSFALDGSVSSPTTCVTECTSKAFPYAAVHNLRTCYCGLTYGKNGQADSYKECNTFCDPGSNGCSANQRFAIYETGATGMSKPLFFSHKQGTEALSGHVIDTVKSIKDVFTCIRYCELLAKCKSINYNVDGYVCELNNATASEGSTVESRGGLIYYAPDNSVETLLFN